MAVQPTVTVSYPPTGDPDFCSVVVNLTAFAPQQTFLVTLVPFVRVTNADITLDLLEVITDANGAAELDPFSFFQVIPNHRSPRRPTACSPALSNVVC